VRVHLTFFKTFSLRVFYFFSENKVFFYFRQKNETFSFWNYIQWANPPIEFATISAIKSPFDGVQL